MTAERTATPVGFHAAVIVKPARFPGDIEAAVTLVQLAGPGVIVSGIESIRALRDACNTALANAPTDEDAQ